MTPDRTSDPSPPLDAIMAELNTFAGRASIARNLVVSDARRAGANDLAGALAFLAGQRAYGGDDPTTKLQRLHASVRESIAAGRAVAEVLGIDLAEQSPAEVRTPIGNDAPKSETPGPDDAPAPRPRT